MASISRDVLSGPRSKYLSEVVRLLDKGHSLPANLGSDKGLADQLSETRGDDEIVRALVRRVRELEHGEAVLLSRVGELQKRPAESVVQDRPLAGMLYLHDRHHGVVRLSRDAVVETGGGRGPRAVRSGSVLVPGETWGRIEGELAECAKKEGPRPIPAERLSQMYPQTDRPLRVTDRLDVRYGENHTANLPQGMIVISHQVYQLLQRDLARYHDLRKLTHGPVSVVESEKGGVRYASIASALMLENHRGPYPVSADPGSVILTRETFDQLLQSQAVAAPAPVGRLAGGRLGAPCVLSSPLRVSLPDDPHISTEFPAGSVIVTEDGWVRHTGPSQSKGIECSWPPAGVSGVQLHRDLIVEQYEDDAPLVLKSGSIVVGEEEFHSIVDRLTRRETSTEFRQIVDRIIERDKAADQPGALSHNPATTTAQPGSPAHHTSAQHVPPETPALATQVPAPPGSVLVQRGTDPASPLLPERPPVSTLIPDVQRASYGDGTVSGLRLLGSVRVAEGGVIYEIPSGSVIVSDAVLALVSAGLRDAHDTVADTSAAQTTATVSDKAPPATATASGEHPTATVSSSGPAHPLSSDGISICRVLDSSVLPGREYYRSHDLVRVRNSGFAEGFLDMPVGSVVLPPEDWSDISIRLRKAGSTRVDHEHDVLALGDYAVLSEDLTVRGMPNTALLNRGSVVLSPSQWQTACSLIAEGFAARQQDGQARLPIAVTLEPAPAGVRPKTAGALILDEALTTTGAPGYVDVAPGAVIAPAGLWREIKNRLARAGTDQEQAEREHERYQRGRRDANEKVARSAASDAARLDQARQNPADWTARSGPSRQPNGTSDPVAEMTDRLLDSMARQDAPTNHLPEGMARRDVPGGIGDLLMDNVARRDAPREPPARLEGHEFEFSPRSVQYRSLVRHLCQIQGVDPDQPTRTAKSLAAVLVVGHEVRSDAGLPAGASLRRLLRYASADLRDIRVWWLVYLLDAYDRMPVELHDWRDRRWPQGSWLGVFRQDRQAEDDTLTVAWNLGLVKHPGQDRENPPNTLSDFALPEQITVTSDGKTLLKNTLDWGISAPSADS